MENAEEELARSSSALAFSGLAAGLGLGLTALALAMAHAHLGTSGPALFAAALVFPVGFVAVIIG